MTPRPARRFSIADIMILVPAAAVATLLIRAYMPGFFRQLGYISTFTPDPWGLWRVLSWIGGPVSCGVVPIMAALIAIRLRRPRPRRIRLASQPGFVACLAVMASLVPGLAWALTIRHRQGFLKAEGFEQLWVVFIWWSGTAVAGAWLALALAGRFRPEPSWIDRIGRALGAYWLILLLGPVALRWSEVVIDLLPKGWPS